MERLAGRVRLPWAIRTAIGVLVVWIALAAVDRWLYPLPARIIWVVAATLLLLGLIHVFARYRRWRYELQTDALVLQRGVITHVGTVVPFVRVQHVDTRRGPLDRLLGLSNLVIYTAGTRGSDVTIPGLERDVADELQAELRDLAREAEPADAV